MEASVWQCSQACSGRASVNCVPTACLGSTALLMACTCVVPFWVLESVGLGVVVLRGGTGKRACLWLPDALA